MLALEGLVAMPWSMNERSGVAFRANRVKIIGVAGGSPNGKPAEKATA